MGRRRESTSAGYPTSSMEAGPAKHRSQVSPLSTSDRLLTRSASHTILANRHYRDPHVRRRSQILVVSGRPHRLVVGSLRIPASLTPLRWWHDVPDGMAYDEGGDTTSDTTQHATPRNSEQP
jgi:hypothetical protein